MKIALDTDERIRLVEDVAKDGEIVGKDELAALFEKKKHPVAYDGFEPSGSIHIAQGLLRAINIQKMIKAGFTFKMLVADWHAAANNKFDGDLEKIRTAGEYFIEVWKACGLDTKHVEFVWASDLVDNKDYWELVLRVARANTVARITRCSQIMGRSESDALSAAQILYPCMQAADIFYLGADVCQLGLDQRKVNVLAREMAEELGYEKPIIVSHHMLMGLGEPPTNAKDATEKAIAMKMSKSKPDTAIFMTDDAAEVARKIKKAFCPEKQITENPILEYCKYIIFETEDVQENGFVIDRPEKFGGPLTFATYADLESAFAEGKLHPVDLKQGVAKAIIDLLAPVHDHFAKDKKANALMRKVASYTVTR